MSNLATSEQSPCELSPSVLRSALEPLNYVHGGQRLTRARTRRRGEHKDVTTAKCQHRSPQSERVRQRDTHMCPNSRTTAPLACLPRLTADVHMEGEKNRASRTLRSAPRHKFSYIMSLRACVCVCKCVWERKCVSHNEFGDYWVVWAVRCLLHSQWRNKGFKEVIN